MEDGDGEPQRGSCYQGACCLMSTGRKVVGVLLILLFVVIAYFAHDNLLNFVCGYGVGEILTRMELEERL